MRSSIVSLLTFQAVLCWRRREAAASSCGVPIATAAVLYGSVQMEETQHVTP